MIEIRHLVGLIGSGFFFNSSTLFGVLIGSCVGRDKLDTLELSSLASMCDGMDGSMLGSWLKLEFIVFGLFSTCCSW